MRARIGVVCLLLCTLSLHAALVAGPERRVAPPSFGGSLQSRAGDLASDGQNFLVVWVDSTPGREGFYATPVDPYGTPRGVPTQPFLTSRLAWKGAHVVWTGSAYLVLAYEENDLNAADFTNRVAVLDRDGQVQGTPFPLAVKGVVRSLTWSGDRALALYQDVTTRRLHASLLDANGQLVRDVELPAGTLTEAAAAPGGFIVFRMLDPGTTASSAFHLGAFRLSGEGEIGPSVKFAELPLVSLTFASATRGSKVGLAVLASSGTAKVLYRFAIDEGTLNAAAYPALTVPLQTQTVQVVSSSEGFTAAFGFLSGSTQSLSAIDFNTSTPARTVYEGAGAAFVRMARGGNVVLATLMTAALSDIVFDAAVRQPVTDPQVIALAGVPQILPAIATSPDGFMAAWLDQTAAPGGTVFVRRFDRSGNALDEEPIPVGQGSISGNVAVTFTGKVWLVAWQNGLSDPAMHVFVRRIAPDGTLLDAEPIDTGSGTQPALASNGTISVLARGGLSWTAISTLAFSPDGVLLDPAPRFLTSKSASMPAIATNGREFVIVWRGTSSSEAGILAARLSESGTPLDASPIAIAQSSIYTQFLYPGVSSNGGDFVIVYGASTRVGAELKTLVESKRLLRTGALADTLPSAAGTIVAEGANPRIAALPSGFVVTFLSTGSTQSLAAVRVDERGAPASETRVLHTGDLYSPTHGLASNAATAWAVYTRFDESLARAQRVFLRPVGEDPGGKRRAARR